MSIDKRAFLQESQRLFVVEIMTNYRLNGKHKTYEICR
jgi:hypothetical protein